MGTRSTFLLLLPACVSLGLALPATSEAATITASANNDFVTAENAGASFLIANRTAASTWEQFQVIHDGDGTTSLQASINGLLVTTDLASGGRLITSGCGAPITAAASAGPPTSRRTAW